jgi:predicted metal-dependent HD superfamily phosphohydrolase
MLEETTGVTNPEPWPLPHRTDLRDRLVTAYSTGRGYHDLLHLTEVLARIVELGAGDNLEVVLAAWYHDAVYDDRGENEERSARLAEADLEGDADVAEVARLVRLTEHHQPEPGDRNGEVLTDADLAILAADPDRYRAYAEGVRREYAGYDDAAFAAGRTAILQALLGKPTLFHTAHAREHWEQVARANVEAEINRLSAG